MIKKIKIFIASSIDDLRSDRLEIGDFFRQLNEIYIDKGIHFTLIKCEDYDNSMSATGKQAQYDEEIRDSDISFFLFFRKVGEYTKHEFEIAIESFKKSEKPKIVTYFRYVNSPEDIDGEVSAFMNMLGNELNHYYNFYGNIDTLKLGMLMQIKLLKLDDAPMIIENGKLTLDGTDMVNCEVVPMFGGNKNLKALYEQRKTIAARYYNLREQCAENPDLYEEFLGVSEEKKKIDGKIKEIEEQTLFMAENMCRETAGGNLTTRQIEGYRLLEKGDIDGALAVLDFGEIVNDINHNSKLADVSKERLQKNVDELLQRAYILSLFPMTSKNKDEISTIFQTACQTSQEYNLDKAVLLSYAKFLQKENELKKALEYAEKLDLYYRLEEREASQKLDFYITISTLYISFNRFAEAEKYLKEAEQEYWKKYAADKTPNNRADIGMCNINLSKLYWQMGDYKKSLEACEMAMGAYGEIHKNGVFEHIMGYATAASNLANLHMQMRDYEKALMFIKQSISLFDEIYEKNPVRVIPEKTSAYLTMGTILKESGKEKDAETCYRAVIKAYGSIMKMDPFEHEERLATAYLNITSLTTVSLDEKIKLITEAEKIFKRLYDRTPEVYRFQMGTIWFNMGLIYQYAGKYGKAENYLKQAISIRREGASKTPAIYEEGLASAYHSLAINYEKRGVYTEAERVYPKAESLYEKIYQQNPNLYKDRLQNVREAMAKIANMTDAQKKAGKPQNSNGNQNNNQQKKNNNGQKNKPDNNRQKQNNSKNNQHNKSSSAAGTVTDPTAQKYMSEGSEHMLYGRLNEAVNSYKKALAIYEGMGKKSEVNVAICKGTLGNIHSAAGNLAIAAQLFIDSINIIDEYVKINPDLHEPNQASVYFSAGKLLRRMGELAYAVGYMWKAEEVSSRLAKKNPSGYGVSHAEAKVEMGLIYLDRKNSNEAEEKFNSALKYIQTIKAADADAAQAVKAEAFRGIGAVNVSRGRTSDALSDYFEALGIFEKLAKNNPLNYIVGFMDCANDILAIYKSSLNASASCELYLRMAKLYESSAGALPQNFILSHLLSCYKSLGNVYAALLNKKLSKEYFCKAYDVCAKLAKIDPSYKKELPGLWWKK